MGEPHVRNGRTGGQQVTQHLTGSDRGQLVDIPDQEQVRPWRDGLGELVGQQEIQHGRLVDHDEVGVQRPVTVVGGVPARAQLQQPVDGGRLVTGQLGQPFGGPAGRCGEHHLRALGAGEGHDRPHGEALAAPGAAGEHGDLLGQSQFHRRLLRRCELGSGPLPQPGQGGVPVHRGEGGHAVTARPQQPQQLARQRYLRPVKGHQVDRDSRLGRVLPRDLLADHALLADELAQRLDHRSGVDLQNLDRFGDQPLFGQETVTVPGGLRQREHQARLDALRAVMRNPDGLGDRVRRPETDSPHVGRQPVRLLAHHIDGAVGVLLVDPHRERGGHPDALEEDHHLLDRFLFLPGGRDRLRALGPEFGNLDQPVRLLFDDVEGIGPEMLDYPFGEFRPDSLDKPRTEIAADALDRRRQYGRVVLDVELPAELRVRAPAPAHA